MSLVVRLNFRTDESRGFVTLEDGNTQQIQPPLYHEALPECDSQFRVEQSVSERVGEVRSGANSVTYPPVQGAPRVDRFNARLSSVSKGKSLPAS